MNTSDDDEDFPLADHPGPGGPKAGDPEMNRARDIVHLDVAGNRQHAATVGRQAQPAPASTSNTALPADSPPAIAWQTFMSSGGYAKSISNFDLFLAGWTARDAQPKGVD